jgi:DNA repair exonuclease SbcCD ATPase subunit
MKSTRRKHSKKVRHSRRKHSRRNHRDGVGFFDNLKAGITNLAGSPLDKAKLKLKQLQEKQTELTTYLSEAEKTKRMTKIETDAKIEEEKEIKKRTSEADVNNENLKNNLKNKNKELSSKKEEVNKIKDYINNRPKRLEEYQAKESADETTNKNKITEINEQIKTIDSEINQIGGYGKIDNDYKIIINEIEKTAKSNLSKVISQIFHKPEPQ